MQGRRRAGAQPSLTAVSGQPMNSLPFEASDDSLRIGFAHDENLISPDLLPRNASARLRRARPNHRRRSFVSPNPRANLLPRVSIPNVSHSFSRFFGVAPANHKPPALT